MSGALLALFAAALGYGTLVPLVPVYLRAIGGGEVACHSGALPAVFLTAASAAAQLAPQQNSQGGVTVAVTPVDVASGNKLRTFRESAAPGGHRREGVLKFAAFEPFPESVELRIARPGEAAARTFRWQLR